MQIKNTFQKHKQVIAYATSMAILLFLLKWLHWRFLIFGNSQDFYFGAVALFFTALGIWVARHFTKTVVLEKEIFVTSENFQRNEAALQKLQLSPREMEVLELLARGMSNAEIAENLHLSVSTIKTHTSNIFSKMEVKSRAKAIEKSKRLCLTK